MPIHVHITPPIQYIVHTLLLWNTNPCAKFIEKCYGVRPSLGMYMTNKARHFRMRNGLNGCLDSKKKTLLTTRFNFDRVEITFQNSKM